MVKFFSQTFKYDDAWATVTLAFFLRYPNPHAKHVLTCDVISRTITDDGNLKTTRLIKKTGGLPKWFPKQFVSRPESWLVEESEVDPEGRVTSCRTRNVDHVKVMRVQEDIMFTEMEDNSRTQQKTTVSIVSNFGWGLTKKIELYGISKFKSNLERSRKGVTDVLMALRASRDRLGSQMYAAAGVGTVSGPSVFSSSDLSTPASLSMPSSSTASMSTLDPSTSTSTSTSSLPADTLRQPAGTMGNLRGVLTGGGLGLGRAAATRTTVLPSQSQGQEDLVGGDRRPSSPASVSSID